MYTKHGNVLSQDKSLCSDTSLFKTVRTNKDRQNKSKHYKNVLGKGEHSQRLNGIQTVQVL